MMRRLLVIGLIVALVVLTAGAATAAKPGNGKPPPVLSVVERTADAVVTVKQWPPQFVSASCAAGETLTGGGYATEHPYEAGQLTILESYPDPNLAQTWTVSGYGGTGHTVLTVFAMCARVTK